MTDSKYKLIFEYTKHERYNIKNIDRNQTRI